VESGGAGGTAGALECCVHGDGVRLAEGADTAVASEDLVAEVAGVGAKAPLMNAVVAAEGATALGDDLKLTPAAQGKAIRALRQRFASGMASFEGTRHEHGLRILLSGSKE